MTKRNRKALVNTIRVQRHDATVKMVLGGKASRAWVGSGVASDRHARKMVESCRARGIKDPIAHLLDTGWLV